MSIFGKIKDAIFGSAKAKEAAPAGSAAPASPGAAAGASPPKPTAAAAPAASAPISQVDVEAVLTKRAAQNTVGESVLTRMSFLRPSWARTFISPITPAFAEP